MSDRTDHIKQPVRADHRFPALFVIGLITLFSAILMVTDPLPQDAAYHRLADRRSWLGVPNFLDIASNLPFAVVGLAGLGACWRRPPALAAASWSVFFVGLILVAIGSTYYHRQPNNATLLWDRLPMTVSFMSLFVALLLEHGFARNEKTLLPVAVLTGLISVVYWRFSHDLRFYAFVQFGTLAAIPLILMLRRGRYSHRHYLLYGLLFYLLAKLLEVNDQVLFQASGRTVSGHTLKHLAAAAATACVYLMLKRRSPLKRL